MGAAFPGQTLRVELVNDLPPLDPPPSPSSWTAPTSGRPPTSTRTACTCHRRATATTSSSRSSPASATTTRSRSRGSPGRALLVPPAQPRRRRPAGSRRDGGRAHRARRDRRGARGQGGQGAAVVHPGASSWTTTSRCRIRSPTRRGRGLLPTHPDPLPVNGVVDPKITMYPGEVQRWRMLNAAEGKFMNLVAGRSSTARPRLGRPDPAAPEPAANMFSCRRATASRCSSRRAPPGTYELDADARLEPATRAAGHPVDADATSTIAAGARHPPIVTVVVVGERPRDGPADVAARLGPADPADRPARQVELHGRARRASSS